MIRTLRVARIDEKEDLKGRDILDQIKNPHIQKVRCVRVYRLEGIDKKTAKILAEKVGIININSIKTLKKIRKIDLIKIDIEGTETEVLETLKNFLSKTENIIIEYHMVKNTKVNSFDKILDILNEYKFHVNIFGSYRSITNKTNPFVFFINGGKNEK